MLKENHVNVFIPYNDIYMRMLERSTVQQRWLTLWGMNYTHFYKNLPWIQEANPTTILMKAIKNETEIRMSNAGQLKDSVASQKFIPIVAQE